jgi:hypothetical protein
MEDIICGWHNEISPLLKKDIFINGVYAFSREK